MVVITKYRANDGQEFESKELCLEHEKNIEALNALKTLCSNCQTYFREDGECIGCPFAKTDNGESGCAMFETLFKIKMPSCF